MTVKELKSLLELPDGVSQEKFDNSEVLISNEECSVLNPCRVEESGYAVFGYRCDKDGNPIGEDSYDEKYNYPVFLINI